MITPSQAKLLRAAYLSGQISEAQWQAHIVAGDVADASPGDQPVKPTAVSSDELRLTARLLADEVGHIREVFGAPGDRGYHTREGQALSNLYMAWTNILPLLYGESA
ncbi:hypothetical protein ACETRX_36945 [Labrys portucalensis]|uniref:Uncharacterized protein n=1 Tax=Labrys neptuniae TaxID=376174 RepID=A0ABV6ZSJ8_9HYPH